MKSLKAKLRPMVVVVLVLLGLGVAQNSLAQTVSVSPGDLSFGIPTGTPPPLAITDMVTVNVTGTGQATLSNFAITGGPYAGDFTFNGNACLTPQTAPTTCQVGVLFTSTQTAGTLETATLSFNSSTQTGPITVPLNGAYGAIKLFGPIDVDPSLISFLTWTQNPPYAGYTVQGTNINLSCPAGVTATLSSTPDGSGNVFQDNTIQFIDTVGIATTTTTNVCTGGDPNFVGFTGFPAGSTNCFQAPYEHAAQNYLGQNPDLATFPQSGGALGSFIATYGVNPLNVAGLLTPGSQNSSQLQSVTVQLQDAGGDLGAATLHLVTSCSPAGITPGGTITGNPITPNDPASLTQTYAFANSPGQNISLIDSTTQNPPPSGAVPAVTDIGVPQSLFSQLVAGTSAAPAVCLRMSGEVDSLGNPMCKGFLIQCTLSGTTSGSNCDPTISGMSRSLFDAVQFASPDAPVGLNFLYGPVGTPAADACSNVLNSVSGAACATNTGPGILMGSDNWLCAPEQNAPCTPLEPNTSTIGPTYSASNCELTGSVAGDLCPLDTLTQFMGAADPSHGGTTAGKNSVLIPVVNMPLPSTAITNATFQSNGWVPAPNSTAQLTFTANAASYNPSITNPPSNTFVAAPAYSVTYGITPANMPLPDTTYPVSGDITLFNSTANANFADPLCSTSTTSSFSPPTVIITPPQDGIYNLHYFTTDCALTEELIFNPQGSQLTDPTANWASFRVVTFGVDTVAPTFSCNSPNTSVWYNTNQTATCTVTDQDYVANVSGSGFSPLTTGIQGSQTETVNVSTNVATGSFNSVAPTNSPQACDLAGNCLTVSAGPFKIDLQPPTITGPTLSSAGPYYVNGPPVTVTFICSDGAGSGIAGCTATDALSGGGTNNISTGGTISASVAGTYTITVTALDNAGNQTSSSLMYTVAPLSTTTLISSLNPSPYGKSITFTATVSSSSGTPTGTVEFLNGTTVLKTVPLKSGSAKYITAQLPQGSNSMTAIYSGDSHNSASTSLILIQIVQAPTTITLGSSLNPSIYYQTVTFTAIVSSTIGAPQDGELVTFKQGSTVLGTGALSSGTATFSTLALPEGDDRITAVYGGDEYFLCSQSETLGQVVAAASTTTVLISSQNPSSSGQPVTFTATVTPQFGGTVPGNVTFMDGTKQLKVVPLSGGVASYTTSKLASGLNNISATYYSYNGNRDFAGSSASLTQTVH
ncbi:MAG: Ig-like domain repeat protein [Candidatus Sulfotelmatobacter sp.]|jgi:hypothetical protein